VSNQQDATDSVYWSF